jgi:phenylalanyl-tRNA synthetase alpha subunit
LDFLTKENDMQLVSDTSASPAVAVKAKYAKQRAHIKSIFNKYPDMKPAEVARWANCDAQLVYQMRWEKKHKARAKARAKAQAKANANATPVQAQAPTTAHTTMTVHPTVSIKEACEILQRAVNSVDNLDVTVMPTLVQFDYQGSLYAAPPAEASVLLDAIKTLKSYAV